MALPKDVERYVQSSQEELRQLIRDLCAIPAPSHHEEMRAAFIRDWFVKNGAEDVEIDEAKNVLCRYGVTEDNAVVVLMAHTDTVFPDTEPMPFREEGDRMYCPGVTDDTAQLAVLMVCARYVFRNSLPVKTGILFVANSCEEGLGNLDGTKALYEREADRVGEHVAFDVHLGEVVGLAVGSHRWRLGVSCAGGHSYFDFGAPNAILELSRLIEGLYDLERGASTTVNVGRIEGGTTVNAIAASASALVEYRSTSEAELAAMRSGLESLVEAATRPGVDVTLEEIGVSAWAPWRATACTRAASGSTLRASGVALPSRTSWPGVRLPPPCHSTGPRRAAIGSARYSASSYMSNAMRPVSS